MELAKNRMRRVPEKVDVYESGTNFASPADDRIPYEQGRLLVESGRADFVKHGKAIRLRGSAAIIRAGSAECNRAFVEEYLALRVQA